MVRLHIDILYKPTNIGTEDGDAAQSEDTHDTDDMGSKTNQEEGAMKDEKTNREPNKTQRTGNQTKTGY